MERIIVQNKFDIMQGILNVRHDLEIIRAVYFNLKPVDKALWEISPEAGLFYHKSKIEMLKAAGVMKDPRDYGYGYFRSNKNNAAVNDTIIAVDKLLEKITDYLKDQSIVPKRFRFTEAEKSLFRVIEGNSRDSWLVACLKRGAVNV